MTKCQVCGKKIPKVRLNVLPETKHCVKCSDSDASVGITVWEDKHTPVMLKVSPEEAEEYWRLERAEGREDRSRMGTKTKSG